ncbi:MAG TPA: NAD(P)/FAD-dependent oxidoreductase [Frankiaceae bacterium]|nr:NAD(P)/FAD-dependent oxidoreductase [Frankiaceae bacterium]
MTSPAYDAVVVGSGPNGLAAAITLAAEGRRVHVVEAADTAGGGMRSAPLTLDGFVHDVCSTIHPLVLASPFFRSRPLADLGVRLTHPEIPYAHPLDGGRAALLHRDVDETADALGGDDGKKYARLMRPLVEGWEGIVRGVLAPLRLPANPLLMARFGLGAIRSVTALTGRFESDEAKALLAGAGAHSMLPLTSSPTGGVALMLATLAHAVGWPAVEGGSQRLADALVTDLTSLGGTLTFGQRVGSLRELPDARCVFLDVTPRQLLEIAGDRLPGGYAKRLRGYRYGPGVFKVDWALDGPIPWANADVARAGTVHVGGTQDELAASEAAANAGRHSERPYVLLVQASVFDPSRAPEGRQTAWAYCHVPAGSTVDMTDAMEAQVERFAPGFRDRILARATRDTKAVERHNENYVGGDINGGKQDLRQLFTRPVARVVPYRTPVRGLYLCSSSTPPGGGVHGMCGYWAAHAALRKELRQDT